MCNPAQKVSSVSGMGMPRRMTIAKDGTVYVLLQNAPWIVRVPASGPAEPIMIRGALDWASEIVVDADNTLLVLGTPQATAPAVSSVQIQRFDAAGNLVGSGKWDVDATRGTKLVGAGNKSGSVIAVAGSSYLLHVASIGANTMPQVLSRLDFMADPFSSKLGRDSRNAGYMAFGPAGEILLAGTHDIYDESWFAILAPNGAPRVEKFDSQILIGQRAMAMSASGAIYESVDTRNERVSTRGFIYGLTSQLASTWVYTVSSSDTVYLGELVALGDGVLAFGSGVWRLNKFGEAIAMATPLTGTAVQAVAIGDFEVLVLEAMDAGFELVHLKFDPLGITGSSAGTRCTVNGDCASNRCCFSGSPSTGKCSQTDQCDFSSVCSSAAECAGGLCIPGSATAGICTEPCKASNDCPAGSYCASPCSADGGAACAAACLIDCLSGGTNLCLALHAGASCAATVNTEGVSVSLCR
jgi:hypothetical protein